MPLLIQKTKSNQKEKNQPQPHNYSFEITSKHYSIVPSEPKQEKN